MTSARSWWVRPETPADAEGIERALRRAFEGSNAANLVRILRAQGGYEAALSWVAVTDSEPERVLGHVLFSPIAIVRGHAPAPALALAPLGVLPDHHGRGIGTALVRAGIEASRDAGYDIVLVLGDPGFYTRFGFTLAADDDIAPPQAEWAPTFQALGLSPGALATVRGTARYPQAFQDA